MSSQAYSTPEYTQTECRHYELDGAVARCTLCPRQCVMRVGEAGACRARMNIDGRLILTTYGACSSTQVDPIEKKPLFHFHPGRRILSLGSLGCNLSCKFCQNWRISQSSAGTRFIAAPEAVEMAAGVEGNVGIAYTYNEPLVWFEYLMDTAPLVREAGLKNVLVTNGEINERPLRELLPHLDAMNIDLKAMDEGFYRDICGGLLPPVLRTIEIAHQMGVHIELTNLLIPGHNDRPDQITALVDWIAALDAGIPLHISRYHPDYRMTEPATPPQTLLAAREIAMKSLRHVYLGNIYVPGAEDTLCPECGKIVIRRAGFSITAMKLDGGNCASCGSPVGVVV